MKVGLNIRAVRKQKGLTLDGLSELCGINRDDLGLYERGKLTPRAETVKRIAAALEVPITSIQNGMGWTESKATEDWERSKNDSLLRDGILENLMESCGDKNTSGDKPELNESSIRALMEAVKASIPALVEYMKDVRPEQEITCEILKELDIEPENSTENLVKQYALTDEQWEQLCGLLPPEKTGSGRPFKSNRLMLDAILYRMKSSVAWSSLPECFGRYKCVTERLRLWRKLGVWQQVIDKLSEMEIIEKNDVVMDSFDS